MAALLKGTENSFSCMISIFFIVLSVFIYPKMCLDSDLNSIFLLRKDYVL